MAAIPKHSWTLSYVETIVEAGRLREGLLVKKGGTASCVRDRICLFALNA